MITRQSICEKYPVKPLGVVADFLDNRRRPVKESDRKDGPFPYYGANGQQGNIDGYLFDEPLILLAEDGGFFDNPDRGIAYRISGKTWVNNHAHVLKPKAGMDFDFLCRVLENYDVMPYISGSTRAKLTKGQAEKIDIPVPPLDEQKRIAAILDQADELRRKRQRAIDRLNQLGQAIFHEMFGNFAGGGVPVAQLGALTSKIGSGATPKGGDSAYKDEGTPLIRSMNVRDGEFSEKGLAFLDDQQAGKLNNVIVQANDVLLNITGASVARVCLAPPHMDGARVNQHVSIIRLSKSITSEFLEAFLLMPRTKRKLLTIAEAGATRQAITKAQIEDLEVPVPDLSRQQQFIERLRLARQSAVAMTSQSIAFDSMFASLQHRAFQGKL